MKRIRIVAGICFFILLMVPVFLFNREENVVSRIDNRALTNNPFGSNFEAEGEVDLTDTIETYIQDRIGLRDEMIQGYTVLNDRLFHEMVHPTYMYGKDGYVFKKAELNRDFDEYHMSFADMVEKIQKYCEEREVPFLFVFEPSKNSLLSDQLPDGINYNNEWVVQFEEELDKRGIHYIDNTELLREKYDQGEMVFNKQYDAGHWNDLGAFYGVNHLLEAMKQDVPEVHINEMEEFDIGQILRTSLPVSNFAIHENVPYFTGKDEVEERTEKYDEELERDERYTHFGYTVNEQRLLEGSPKTLVFQGSYMNEIGSKFLENSLGEYIAVHDYQNVMNIDYYFNIFKPDYVIFEVAEYVFTDEYFFSPAMKEMDLNPAIDMWEEKEAEIKPIGELNVSVKEGSRLASVEVENLPADTKYAYLVSDGEVFDLRKREEDMDDQGNMVYEAAMEKEKCESGSFTVTAVDDKLRAVRYE